MRAELEGNICRCTGYHNIVKAVLDASEGKVEQGRKGKKAALRRSGRAAYRDSSALYCTRNSLGPLFAFSGGEQSWVWKALAPALLRKEDKRFITGKGRYTDDMVVPGMKHAHFVRSPARPCGHQEDRHQRRRGDAGRHWRADRQGTEGRRHRQPDLRLDDPFQGRLADEDGRMVAAGTSTRCAMSAMRSPSSWPTPRARPAMRPKPSRSTYKDKKAVVSAVDALKPGAPQIHPEAAGNLIFDWEIGDAKATDAAFTRRGPCDEARHRQQPAGAKPDGAARDARRL